MAARRWVNGVSPAGELCNKHREVHMVSPTGKIPVIELRAGVNHTILGYAGNLDSAGKKVDNGKLPFWVREHAKREGWRLLLDHFREAPSPMSDDDNGLPRGFRQYLRWYEMRKAGKGRRVRNEKSRRPVPEEFPENQLPPSVVALRRAAGDQPIEFEDLSVGEDPIDGPPPEPTEPEGESQGRKGKRASA